MNRLHQIWIDSNELPGLCLAGKEGDQFRATLDKPAKLVHEFNAASNYEAMVYYYKFMNFGKYESCFLEFDSKPYEDSSQVSPTNK